MLRRLVDGTIELISRVIPSLWSRFSVIPVLHVERLYKDRAFESTLEFCRDYLAASGKRAVIVVIPPVSMSMRAELAAASFSLDAYEGRIAQLAEFADIGLHGHYLRDVPGVALVHNYWNERAIVATQMAAEIEWLESRGFMRRRIYSAGWWYCDRMVIDVLSSLRFEFDFSFSVSRFSRGAVSYCGERRSRNTTGWQGVERRKQPARLWAVSGVCGSGDSFGLPRQLLRAFPWRWLRRSYTTVTLYGHDWDVEPKAARTMIQRMLRVGIRLGSLDDCLDTATATSTLNRKPRVTLRSRLSAFASSQATMPRLVMAVVGSGGLRLAGMGLSFLVGIQLARGLGAEGYGVYGIAMATIALLMVPAEFGMPQLLIREVAAAESIGNWGRMRGIVQWAQRSAWILSMTIALGTVGWILLTDPGFHTALSRTLICGTLMVPAMTLGRQSGAALLGLHHIVKGQLPDAVVRPAVFSLLLLGAHLWVGSLSPMLAMLLGALSATAALLVVRAMFRRLWPAQARTARVESHGRQWWASAIPMALTEGMRGLQGNVATLAMGVLASVAATGVFRVASSISVVVALPVTLCALVGSPTISRLYARGEQRNLQRVVSWLAAGMTAGSILLTLPFVLAGEFLLGRLFGPEFIASNPPLLVLCAGGIIYSALGPAIITLNMTGHERRVTRAFVQSLAVLLVLALPLVHLYGALGAATASAVSLVVGNFVMWRDVRKFVRLDSSVLSLFRRMSNVDG